MGTFGGSVGSVSMGGSVNSIGSAGTAEIFAADEVIKWSQFRKFCHGLAMSSWFSSLILIVIFINTGMITLQTLASIQTNFGWYFTAVDNSFLALYTFELLLKFFVFQQRFFKSSWNLFDLFIVGTSYLAWLDYFSAAMASVNTDILRVLRMFRAIRALRALRVLRTVSFLRQLQDIVATIFKSIPALMSTGLLLVIMLFIFAVIAMELFGTAYPERFGNIWVTTFALFQLITLDDWSEYRIHLRATHNLAITLFCVVFIVVETFILINLFMAVIVNNLEYSVNTKKKRRFRVFRRGKKRTGSDAGSVGTASSVEDIADPVVGQAEIRADPGQTAPRGGRDVDYYYGSSSLAMRDRQMLGYYFTLLASLESHLDSYQAKQKMLDDLVDLAMPESKITEEGRV